MPIEDPTPENPAQAFVLRAYQAAREEFDAEREGDPATDAQLAAIRWLNRQAPADQRPEVVHFLGVLSGVAVMEGGQSMIAPEETTREPLAGYLGILWHSSVIAGYRRIAASGLLYAANMIRQHDVVLRGVSLPASTLDLTIVALAYQSPGVWDAQSVDSFRRALFGSLANVIAVATRRMMETAASGWLRTLSMADMLAVAVETSTGGEVKPPLRRHLDGQRPQ
jgi:hypothetical protein